MRCLAVVFITCLLAAPAGARLPVPSAEQEQHFLRELTQLEKTFFADQRKNNQFGDHFWRESKRLADRSGTIIIPAVAKYCRKWQGEEPLIFVPLVALLPRAQTLTILHEMERSGNALDRGFAHEFLIELDMSDTKEAVQRYSTKRPNQAMERTADRCTLHFRDDFHTSTPSDARSRPPSLILSSLDVASSFLPS